MHCRSVRVDSHLGDALRLADLVNRLADDETPTLKARVLSSRGHIAFDASEQHGQ
jgi:hypothetical protein